MATPITRTMLNIVISMFWHCSNYAMDGCEFASLRAQGHVDGLKGLTVTDTTGAGDIFGGCAVWRLLQSGKAPAALDEAELRGIAEFACRVAGRSTEKSGGISAITEMPDEVFMG